MDVSFLDHETLIRAPFPIRNAKLRNPNHSPKVTASRRKKRSSMGWPRSNPKDLDVRNRCDPQSPSMVVKLPAKALVMGQVKILKRGEPLGVLAENREPRAKSDEAPDSLLGSINRMGPDPEVVREINRVVDGVFAGTAFVASPSPSLVPVPVFLRKGIGSGNK